MAYATGVSTSLPDLISRLKTFAATQGWTAGPTWTAAAGTTYPLTCTYMSKGGFFYNMSWLAQQDTLLMDISTGSDGASLPHLQPGSTGYSTSFFRTAACRSLLGPHVGYHFFSDGFSIQCVVEIVSGVFSHFSFGEIRKAGTFPGAQFVEGSFWNQTIDFQTNMLYPWERQFHVRPFEGLYNTIGNIPVGNFIGYTPGSLMRTPFGPFPSSTGNDLSAGGGSAGNVFGNYNWSCWSWGLELINDSPNQFNSRSVLVPAEVVVAATLSTATNWMQIGQIPTVAAINIANINPKDVINTDWMVFPLCQKNGPGTQYVNSQNIGLAYKK